ncbi:MAG: conjugative transposon protein TraK [Rikenellaceae bacterium]
MQFKSLKNIETSFQQIRTMAIAFVVLCCATTAIVVGYSYSFALQQRQKIYVLDEGKSLMLALSQDLAQNRPVEAREHIKRFHELFFTLAPDKSAIESNIKRALYLANKSAYNVYSDYAESGYYNRIISGDITQRVQIDSIVCNFDRYPYNTKCYARQVIVRESNITERSLITSCNLLNSVRSDNNPHGFMIENFEILENKDLRVNDR